MNNYYAKMFSTVGIVGILAILAYSFVTKNVVKDTINGAISSATSSNIGNVAVSGASSGVNYVTSGGSKASGILSSSAEFVNAITGGGGLPALGISFGKKS